jgi:chemotaxis protein MotB
MPCNKAPSPSLEHGTRKEGSMNCTKQTACLIALTIGVFAIAGCVVSKKDYMVKVEESKNLSSELAALRSEHERLKKEKEALEKQVVELQTTKSDLAEAKSELQLETVSLGKEIAILREDNLQLEEILKAKSDTLSKNIVDLRGHVADLKKENALLKEKNEDLENKTRTLTADNTNLEERIAALQEKADAIERQRKEEILQMRGTYESLLENMKSEIDKGEITITQLKGKLKVNMLDEILFDSGKTTIKPQGLEVLERVGKVLLNVEDRAISIEGHTDDVPIGAELKRKYPTNWELSAARATRVARYLQEKIGIDPKILSAAGYGEYQPVASNETEEGRAKNRRIEIVLIPKEIVPVSRK